MSAPNQASFSNHASAPSHASVPSHASALAPVESTLVLKYSKADLMKVLKIFSETKGQESKAEVPRKRPFKAKVPDIYFGKWHTDCHHFCHQCKDHFETTGTTESNRTPFAILFLCGKINFRWHQHQKQLGGVFVPWEEFKFFLGKNLRDSRFFVDTI